MKAVTIVLALMFCSIGAMADESKGIQTHELYNNCKLAIKATEAADQQSKRDYAAANFCIVFLRGFADGLELGMNLPSKSVVNVQNVSTEALLRSFVNYVNAHPVEMDEEDVHAVLMKAWIADEILKTEHSK